MNGICRYEIWSITLTASSTVDAPTAALEVGAMNIAFDESICELTLWYMMAADLLREDAVLRVEFSCQVELATFMQWQSQKILKSAQSQED